MTEDSTAARISNPAIEHRRWRNKLLDLDEAYHQVCFALPLVTTSICFYLIPLVSVMFAGHLGELELAGATLANSWATTTGLVVMVGLSGALETLCGQGFGARDYRMLGIHLQASCIVSLPFTIFVAILWFFTEPILISIRQDQQIAKYAALYIKLFIPGLFPYAILQNLLRFMQTQSVVLPLYFFSVIQMVVHVGITYSLVHCTGLRYKGAPLSASISIWMSMFMLVIYVMRGKKFERTWGGFSSESFHYALTSLKLALPSALMVCLEYWAFEILVLMAGVMPNSKDTTSLVALCVNTEAIAYMITYGLSAAASTRVSNELGAGDPEKAKKAMAVSLKLSVLLALLVILALALGHKVWAGLFTDSHVIIMGFASMTPFLAISIVADSVQGVLSGVARGCGWQHLVVYVNLGTFYMVGITIAGVLGFKLKLYAKGLWIGLICGLSCQTGSLLLLVMLRKQWTQFNISHNTDAVGV